MVLEEVLGEPSLWINKDDVHILWQNRVHLAPVRDAVVVVVNDTTALVRASFREMTDGLMAVESVQASLNRPLGL